MSRLGLIALILAIGISPRIPLPIAIPGRDFDLRIEDLLIPVLGAYLCLKKGRPHLPRLVGAMALYMVPVAVASVIGIVRDTTTSSRALVFGLKEVEYFCLFLVVCNLTRRLRDVQVAANTVLLVGLANALWSLWQLGTGTTGQLLNISPSMTGAFSYDTYRVSQSYGPGLIGELSPFSAGGLYMFVLLMALARAWLTKSRKEQQVCHGLALCATLSLVVTESRVTIVGAVLGAGLLALLFGVRRLARPLAFGLLVAIGMLYVTSNSEYQLSGRMSENGVQSSASIRETAVWPIVLSSGPWLMVGFGKGALNYARELPITEAHNQYLRVMAESGICGLLCFLLLLVSTLRASAKLATRGSFVITRAVGAATLAGGVGLASAAIFQDAFTAVIPNELFWLLAGLTVAALRIEAQIAGGARQGEPATEHWLRGRYVGQKGRWPSPLSAVARDLAIVTSGLASPLRDECLSGGCDTFSKR